MTWGRWDDLVVIHPKWCDLSLEATGLGFRAVQWARSPRAERLRGHLSEKQLRGLAPGVSTRKFRKLVAELVDAGGDAFEHGILEPTETGYRIHDFDTYGPPQGNVVPARPDPEATGRPKLTRSEAARLAGQASAARRRELNGTAQPSRAPSNVSPNVPERRSVDQRSNDQDQPTELTPDLPDPIPEPTTTNSRRSEPVRPERRSVGGDGFSFETRALTECPRDLYATVEGAGLHRLWADELGVNVWDVQACTLGFVHHWTEGKRAGGRRQLWVTKLHEWIADQHGQGKLVGLGDPPGAEAHHEHASPTREHRRGSTAPARPFALPVPPPSDMTPEEQAKAADAARAELDAQLRKTVAAGAAPKRAAGGAE
jgi:hypothetical protein